MKRYIVLGRSRDIDRWRREHGLTQHEVVAVSTLQGDRALRGYGSGHYELVVLDSFARASERVRTAVGVNVDILRRQAGTTVGFHVGTRCTTGCAAGD